ncbi:MAG: tyrosine-type recombinase/integrase [Verrucomicrobiales bacterium]|nr:tyrosine-type recombinase/integrase [Verrucomicrobiales bacterium]
MKPRYRLYRRGASGRYYAQDRITNKQESLGTSDKAEAVRLLNAKNESAYHPAFNIHLARTYLSAADPTVATRTWKDVMDALVRSKVGKDPSTAARYERGLKQPALETFRDLPVLQTQPEHILAAIQKGTVSTNNYLRRLHSFAHQMGWLPWPVLPVKQWPRMKFKDKRGVTLEEHQRIVTSEKDPERKAFLQLLWHVGASQIDCASLVAENIDWHKKTISYRRRKNGMPAVLRFGDEVAGILRTLPNSGPLFPNWCKLRSEERAAKFYSKCKGLGIAGISLHSYRYAWAERAKSIGYPERYAQEALGHSSTAVHRAYAKHANVELPPLEEYGR